MTASTVLSLCEAAVDVDKEGPRKRQTLESVTSVLDEKEEGLTADTCMEHV